MAEVRNDTFGDRTRGLPRAGSVFRVPLPHSLDNLSDSLRRFLRVLYLCGGGLFPIGPKESDAMALDI